MASWRLLGLSAALARGCADSPDARALRAVRAGNTLLVTFYGDNGPCRASGYTFDDTSGANSLVNGNSMKAWNG
ncbi:hypothetical protein [Streptacidiphilus jiangxiensis]|uniref:Uncharacterized protein n=1 Tax=Streptacidiphilus jiangxiensis TaxID=235985 RepID=A0A1H7KXY2_STRJI|nr:hypothetical protein [Streptacidiphilus jiangxiensis]SEK91671.1 hypothetical protein SAMN05414137_104256 [Streptacidiphilus jiangxiensis]